MTEENPSYAAIEIEDVKSYQAMFDIEDVKSYQAMSSSTRCHDNKYCKCCALVAFMSIPVFLLFMWTMK